MKLRTLITSIIGALLLQAAPVLACGNASWYGPNFHGKRTSSGERFNQWAMTAAHKTLRLGTKVRVTDKKTGRSVVVRINDRGPYIKGRTIDLSRAAFSKLRSTDAGVACVRIEVLR